MTIVLAGLSAAALKSSVAFASGSADLIPRRLLLADADRTSVQLSADGARVGWLSTHPSGRALVWRDLSRPKPDEAIPTRGEIVAWSWPRDPDRVLFVEREGSIETLSAVPIGALEAKRRTLAQGSRVRIVACGADDVVASVLGGDADSSGLFRIRSDGSTRSKIGAGDFDAWWVDGSLQVVAARRPTADGFALHRRTATGEWARFAECGPLDAVPSGVVSVSRDGSRIAYVAREGGDTTALVEVRTATGEKRVLARDAEADLLAVGATVDPIEGVPSSVVSYRVRMARLVLDERVRADVDALAKIRRGDVSIAGQSRDDARWLVRWLDGGPAHYAVWDRKTRRAIDLFDDVPGLEGMPLASRRPFVVRSRDGLDLRCDLYLPPRSDANDDGIPDAPLPAVLFVHGGPWVGFEWNLWPVNRNFQLLANRGYAVIRAGFRGEIGYGSRYVDAGDREWGGAMLRDLFDVTDAAVTRGIAAKERIAIWGWSYGGYAAAAALAAAPDRFACGIAMYGVFDLESFLRTPFASNPFWRSRVGDVDSPSDLERIRRQSPIRAAEAITKPLLVTHGAQDDRVSISQSDAFVAALEKLGRPVTYVVLSEEGHDYGRPASWEAFWAASEAFLHERLGGAVEPFGDTWSRARVEVRAGAARVGAWIDTSK
jgi:dipeptidyl aminopeptidase/acylaminoacyl peptidase